MLHFTFLSRRLEPCQDGELQKDILPYLAYLGFWSLTLVSVDLALTASACPLADW